MRTYQTKLENGNTFTVTVKTPTDNHGALTPCFSVTAEERSNFRRPDPIVACGCMHEDVLKHFPQLRDVVALHLSDAEGAPMFAEANGWYWLAGCCVDGLSERYHGGNQEYLTRTPREILQSHLRISSIEVTDLINTTEHIYRVEGAKAARANFSMWVNGLRPNWAIDAERAERKYGGNAE